MLKIKELLESFLYYGFVYLAIILLGSLGALDNFIPYLKSVSIAFAIPLILISTFFVAAHGILRLREFNFYFIKTPLDDMSFIIVIMLTPFVSMIVFGLFYTIASSFIPFLPYPVAFQ